VLVDSAPGQGTCVRLVMPLAPAPATPRPQAQEVLLP
jgi:signal transduction histidine kinase